MVKYALVVRGEAHVYARVYHHIWDFAPGCLLVSAYARHVLNYFVCSCFLEKSKVKSLALQTNDLSTGTPRTQIEEAGGRVSDVMGADIDFAVCPTFAAAAVVSFAPVCVFLCFPMTLNLCDH